MGKRETTEIAEEILSVLSANQDQQFSLQDIAKKAEVSWESARRYMGLFKNLGIVREINKEGKLFYQKTGPQKSDTLFSIPLNERQKKIIKEIYGTIRNVWKSVSAKPLSKTLVQKIAVDVVEKRYPEIPRVWYLYGELLLLSYEMDEEYDLLTKKEDIDCVKDICIEYESCCDASYKIRRHQYEKKKNQLYLVKEDLYYYLTHSDFTKISNKSKIRQLLNEFITSIKRTDLNSVMLAIVEDFVAETLSIFRHGNDTLLMKAKPAIIGSFEAIWRLVATYEFYNSLCEYYDKDMLQDYFGDRLATLEDSAIEVLEELQDFKSELGLPEDEITQKLKSLMSSAKEFSSKDIEKRKEKIEAIRKEQGEKGVKEFLVKELGLA